MELSIGPTFRAFAKPADQPAQEQCELLVWSVDVGVDVQGQVEVAQFEVVPSFAYETVIVPRVATEAPVQIGLEFRDGSRTLLTGEVVGRLMPCVNGTQVLERFWMEVRRKEGCRR